MNSPTNVVSYAQITFKKLIIQARPANADFVVSLINHLK